MGLFDDIGMVLFGLVIGSFLNVVALRVPEGVSITKPRSRCPSCRMTLRPRDLIPVASFIMLGGRCRYCRMSITPFYPLTEVGTALLFVLAYHQLGISPELLIALPLLSILVVITHIDLRLQLIPDKITFPGMIYFVLIRTFYRLDPWWDYILGFFIAGGLLWLIAILSRGGMGGGDIKLMAMTGLAIGWKWALLAFFIATLVGGLVGAALLLSRRVGRKDAIPFGPFLAIGITLAYLWGDAIWSWYRALL